MGPVGRGGGGGAENGRGVENGAGRTTDHLDRAAFESVIFSLAFEYKISSHIFVEGDEPG